MPSFSSILSSMFRRDLVKCLLFTVNASAARRKFHRAAVSGATALAGLACASSAFAATGTIGAQVGVIAQEFSTAGGFTAWMAMYVGALITFVAGAWYLWQSRQPENRESGKVAAGLAGLVLTGLLITGGNWIQKAANTATGANATITDTTAAVTFQ
jgi:ABC-type transport system involved in cytochrome bd biosynthesis fused ATPase/permease subunit